jgi:myo-inositol-1-phosphate synthase
MSELGVVIIGLNGAVASTVIAGVKLMARGLAPRIGMITERTDANIADAITSLMEFAPIEKLAFAGWDLRFGNVYEGAVHHKVLANDVLQQVKSELEEIKPWPAVFSKAYAANAAGENIVQAKSQREEIAILTKNIEDWKKARGIDRVVMVNLASTESYLPVGDAHKSLEAFEKAIDNNDASITPAMRYFYVANRLGIPYCNFAPSLTNIPALQDHANKHKNPYAGMDGKTGQTLLKTALAPMLRVRRLHLEGWYSTNFLGNNDGLVLDNPGSNKTKVLSKASVLDSIVGYHVENHQVHIHYYKPRGDSKEAWDNIDILGFAGVPMQIKVNFLCQDSALAAPLVLDLVRLLDVSKRVGDYGIQRQLSIFFKSPYAAEGEQPVHDLFKQEELLLKWAREKSAALKAKGGATANGHKHDAAPKTLETGSR